MKISAFPIKSVFFSLFFISLAPSSHAVNLEGKMGLGVSDLGPALIPALSVDWNLTEASALEVNLHMNTIEGDNHLGVGARYQRNLYLEERLNYYIFGGGGLLSQQVNDTNKSGFFFEAGTGAKFFLNGLPNLSLSLGGGLKLSTGGAVSFRTFFFSGFHYYF